MLFRSQNGDPKKDEPKDSNAEATPQSGDKQEQPDSKDGKGAQPKPVNAQEKPSQGEAQSANGEKRDDAKAAAAEEERREPGQMTKAEAMQLLDALKGDERKAPAISVQGRAAGQPNDRKTLKDW